MATITIQNQNWVFDDGGTGYPSEWYGYYVPQTEVSDLTIDSNYISSNNVNGYIIEAGDEGVSSGNNYFDDAVVTNNYIKWNGTLATGIITHGLFFGYQLDVQLKYNYLDNVPMGIIRKSNGMTDTAGVVAYNIIVNGAPGVVCKGMNGVRIYNNTFYSDHTSATCNRAMIEMYYNDSIGTSATSENCKIKNNIFYSVSDTIKFISVDAYSTTGFECDYNVYWCENSVNNEPIFTYHGSTYTWTQWRALGYDAHSVIVNPKFTSTTNTYVPSTGRGDFGFIPAYRLDYGINLDLGELVSHGIDYENTWSTTSSDGTLKTQIQDSNWQVGAYVLRTGNDIGGDWYLAPWGSDTLGDGSFNNPYFTLDRVWPSLSAGDTVYLRGGTYVNTARQDLTGINGTEGNLINIWAYPNETPVFTDDGVMTFGSWPASYIYFTGDYFHWKGIEWSYIEQRVGPIGGWCLWANNSDNNIFEQLVFHHNSHTLSVYGTSTNNLILNCDAYCNQDPYSTSPYEDSDGINIHYTAYGTTNTIRGCRMWWNSDDGLDCWNADGEVIVENCWVWYNGFIPETFNVGGNGEGFKLGQTTTDYSTEVLRYVSNSLAYYNRRCGFTPNGANCIHHFYNNIAYDNQGQDYGAGFFLNFHDNANILRNNISFDNSTDWVGYYLAATFENNSYNATRQPLGPVVTTADFVTVDYSQLTAPRQYDGSLPIINFLHPTTGSGILNEGTTTLSNYDGDGKEWGSPATIGAFEYVEQLTGYYVAPFGDDTTGTGTFSNPYATLSHAWDVCAAAGVTIYMRGGLYEIDSYQRIDLADGTSGNTINVYNYPGEQPTIVPSSSYPETSTTAAIFCYQVDYVHFKGLEIAHFVQRRYGGYDSDYSWGGTTSFQFYQCSYCTAELLNCHHGGFGLTINGSGSTGNLLLNCDSHHNYDPYTCGYEYGGVDGITIRVESAGTSHTMRGCRMWNNSDDGVDLWASTGLITIDSCWSWNNGYREDGTTAGGDGGGFKLGPVVNDPYTGYESQHLRTITNNIACLNKSNGFVQNAAYCIIHFYNNTAYLNGGNGVVLNNTWPIPLYHIVRNNLCYKNYVTTAGGRGYTSVESTTDHNTFLYNGSVNSAYEVTDSDFVSLDASVLGGDRQSDGSLPVLTFLHLAEGSDLIGTGINVGLSTDADGEFWSTGSPSLGAFEYPDYIVRPTVTTTAITSITTTTASTGGNVTDDGGSSVTSRGVCWNNSGTPTVADDTTSDGTGTGAYTSGLTGLTPDTIYYVRAYAVNTEGTSYGNEVSFETNEVVTVPAITTTTVTDIQTTTATSGGNVLSDGNATVTARGVCWNTTGTPTTADDITNDGSGEGSFISYLTGLTDTTHYYVRAYATNSEGTAYGAVVEFDTLTVEDPTLLTDDLVAFYKMDEFTLPLVDSVNGYNIVNSGNAPYYFRPGKINYGVEYTYSNSYHAVVGDAPNILPPGETFTISFWIYFVELPVGQDINQQVLYWSNSGTPGYFLSIYYRGSSDKFNFYFKTDDGGYCETQVTSGTLSVATWYHVVCVANGIGNRANMYINTTKYTSYTDQMDIALQADGYLYIGYLNTVVPVIEANAIIDELGIWHRALTEEEVGELYYEGAGLTYPFDGSIDVIDVPFCQILKAKICKFFCG